jgi:N,N'-diacetyllegionaminate synthase
MIWVAEIGSNHGGSKALAYELIRQAKLSGATIAKFQLGWTPLAEKKYAQDWSAYTGTPSHPRADDSTVSARYIDDWAEDIAKWCADMDIEFMASIWSMEGLEVARSVGMKRYKIAHQMRDRELGRAILSDGKEVFISGECLRGDHKQIRGIYCQRDYPAYPNDKYNSVKGIGYHGIFHGVKDHMEGTTLVIDAQEFVRGGGFYGYSSHMHGIADALIAVTRGAHYIEKHFCLHNYAGFPKDAAFSLTPPEFKQMVDIGNEIARLR